MPLLCNRPYKKEEKTSLSTSFSHIRMCKHTHTQTHTHTQETEWEKIFVNHLYNKELVFRVYKDFSKPCNTKKEKKENEQKTWTMEKYFTKDDSEQKRYSTLFAWRKQIKTSEILHIRIPKMKNDIKWWWEWRETRSLICCWWGCKMAYPFGK